MDSPIEICSHPESGAPVLLKDGRYGPYLQCGEKMKSLLPGMKIDEVTPNIAQGIISLPKELGKHPESNDSIKVDIDLEVNTEDYNDDKRLYDKKLVYEIIDYYYTIIK